MESLAAETIDLLNDKLKEKINDSVDKIFLSFSDVPKKAEETKRIVRIIMRGIYSDPLVLFNLDRMLVQGSRSLAAHCLNTSILATTLAIKAGLPKGVVEDIAIGAMLHDIGKLKVDQKLGDVTYTLNSPEEMIAVQQHTVEGYQLVDNPKFSTSVKKIVLMHHVWEKHKYSFNAELGIYESYPAKYKGQEINPKFKDLAVSIVQTCDTFESMTNKVRELKKTRLEVIEYIRSMESVRFGKGARLLVSNISPFAIGAEVIMNDGQRAIVVEHNNCPDRPRVQYITGSQSGQTVNLIAPEGRKLFVEREA